MNLLYAEIKREYNSLKYQPLKFLIGNILLIILFLVIKRVSMIDNIDLMEYRTGNFHPFIAWLIITTCVAKVPTLIESEIVLGSIHRLILSRYSLWAIFLARCCASMLRLPISIPLIYLTEGIATGVFPQFVPTLLVLLICIIIGITVGFYVSTLSLIVRPVIILYLPAQIITISLIYKIFSINYTFIDAMDFYIFALTLIVVLFIIFAAYKFNLIIVERAKILGIFCPR